MKLEAFILGLCLLTSCQTLPRVEPEIVNKQYMNINKDSKSQMIIKLQGYIPKQPIIDTYYENNYKIYKTR